MKVITIREMTHFAGDVAHEFDLDDPKAAQTANKMLADCLAKGGAAFTRAQKGADPVKMPNGAKEVDPTAPETLLRRQLQGG